MLFQCFVQLLPFFALNLANPKRRLGNASGRPHAAAICNKRRGRESPHPTHRPVDTPGMPPTSSMPSCTPWTPSGTPLAPSGTSSTASGTPSTCRKRSREKVDDAQAPVPPGDDLGNAAASDDMQALMPAGDDVGNATTSDDAQGSVLQSPISQTQSGLPPAALANLDKLTVLPSISLHVYLELNRENRALTVLMYACIFYL